MPSKNSLAQRIDLIEERNRRVEADKAWETSLIRKILIALLTYFTVAIYMKFVLKIDPWINALVPTLGFLLSTLTLQWGKNIWIYFQNQKHDRKAA